MPTDPYDDKITDPSCRAMRDRSGRVDDDRPLVAFLYQIGRDLGTGAVEPMLDKVDLTTGPFMFTNGWLARWAQDTADRLEGELGDFGVASIEDPDRLRLFEDLRAGHQIPEETL